MICSLSNLNDKVLSEIKSLETKLGKISAGVFLSGH